MGSRSTTYVALPEELEAWREDIFKSEYVYLSDKGDPLGEIARVPASRFWIYPPQVQINFPYHGVSFGPCKVRGQAVEAGTFGIKTFGEESDLGATIYKKLRKALLSKLTPGAVVKNIVFGGQGLYKDIHMSNRILDLSRAGKIEIFPEGGGGNTRFYAPNDS